MMDELVKRLREVEEMLKVAQFKEATNLIAQAADAIEELQGWNNTFSDSVAMLMRQIAELSKRVPKTPHGRLIDADAFETAMFNDPYQDFVRILAQLPTIIPAEEGET